MEPRGFLLQNFLVVIASFFVATVESQTVSVYPPSVGVRRGEPNVLLGCNVTGLPSLTYIVWSYYPASNPTGITIYSTYDNNNQQQGNFDVKPVTTEGDTTSLDLVIKVANAELATQYKCALTPITSKETVAHVVALDPVECPESNVEYYEFNMANLSCSVNYYMFDAAPSTNPPPKVMWYKDEVEVPGVVIMTESNRITALLTKNVTSADDDQEFVCRVDFAGSNPDYTDNCTSFFYVIHAVSEINFYPPSSVEAPVLVLVGETINCTANGRPVPTIEWYDSNGMVLSSSSELPVTDDMRYWDQPITLFCRANNTIDGGVTIESAEGNYTFTVDVATPIVQTSGMEPWLIAVIVIVSVLLIAAIAVGIFFIIRHRKKKKAKPKTTNGSAAARTSSAAATTTVYTPVPTSNVSNVNRPAPTTAPRTTGSIASSNLGPPGPDNRNGTGAYGDNAGFGDLGVQTYGGSNQAVNAYPPARSLHGSNQALGVGVSMNPNPGYPVRGNPALNASITTNPRPSYPYTGSNSALNTSLSVAPNAGPGYGRQPSIASSSVRSHASSYNAPAMEMNRYPTELSSMHGSEV